MLGNLTSCFWPNNPQKCNVVLILQYLFGSISFICLFILILAILAFKLYRIYTQRLILFMCLSSIVNVSMFFTHVDDVGRSSCIAQGFVSQYASWAELLWVCVITSNILLVYRGFQPQKYEKRFHLFVWSVSAFWSVIPLFGMQYGQAGSWCWIKRQYTAMRFGVWFVPLMLIILALLVVCAYITCSSNSDPVVPDRSFFEMETDRTLHQQEVKPLLAYPIIYFILNVPLLIYRIDDAVRPDDPPNYTLLILTVITSPLLGTFNALAFCVIEDTLKDSCSVAAIKNMVCCTGETTRIVHNYEVVDEDEKIASLGSTKQKYEAVA